MKYLFYSLYIAYTRILKEKAYMAYIAAVLTFVEISLVNAFIVWLYGKESFNPYLHSIIACLLLYFNHKYFSIKEKEILNKIRPLRYPIKLCIVIVSYLLMGFIIWLWLGHGLEKILGPAVVPHVAG